MRDNDHCQNHPENEVSARCLRFNRRFCDLDFKDHENPAECLSAGTYCEYRGQCLVWAKVRDRRRRLRERETAPSMEQVRDTDRSSPQTSS